MKMYGTALDVGHLQAQVASSPTEKQVDFWTEHEKERTGLNLNAFEKAEEINGSSESTTLATPIISTSASGPNVSLSNREASAKEYKPHNLVGGRKTTYKKGVSYVKSSMSQNVC